MIYEKNWLTISDVYSNYLEKGLVTLIMVHVYFNLVVREKG